MASCKEESESWSAALSAVPFVPKASAKRSVLSAPLREDPVFIRKSCLTRLRDYFQPLLTQLEEYLIPEKEVDMPTEDEFNVCMDYILTTVLENEMARSNLIGSCEDVQRFWRSVPKGDYEEISGLLMEMNVINNVDKVCEMFRHKAVEMDLSIEAAFTLMCELLNEFSVEPDEL